jgi:hypothetical protein
VSDKGFRECEWELDHPLFRTGTFHFPVFTRGGDSLFPGGHYNPVTDSIFVRYPEEEILDHEATHRIFSIFAAGVLVLRRLAGISHSLLYFLFDAIDQEGVQVAGRNLDTLRIANLESSDHLAKTTLSCLKGVEYLFDLCYRVLVPPAEIAAIDFAPGQGEYGWFAEGIKNTAENQRRKNQQISALAAQLAQEGSEWLRVYDGVGVREELGAVWTAYTSIEDDRIREGLLKLATSSILRTSGDRYTVENPLEYMRHYLPYAKEPEASDRLSEIANEKFGRVEDILDEITERALGNIAPEYRAALDLQTTIDYLVVYSVPVPSNPVLPHLHTEYEETLIDPYYSLLFFWVEPDGRQRVMVNPTYRYVVEEQLIPDIPELGKDWWRVVAGLESLRQGLKKGKPVVCPFRRWEGVNCNEECSIRGLMSFLQDNTELSIEGACQLYG